MTETPAEATPDESAIDPADLETALRVIAAASKLPSEHADVVAIRRATSAMYKAAKSERRRVQRNEIAEANRAVIEATATGAPDRIDDETRGLTLAATSEAKYVGELRKAQACYICKQPYTKVESFYHQLCPSCAEFSHGKRNARTDLTGKRALLTGGRAKIGMHIALRLLRDGAHTTITTRFPRDAARRFASLPDSADWIDRLRIVGIDLRDPSQVVRLADSVAARGPLDILINNAAQTVRRSPGSYSLLADAESQPLPAGVFPETESLGHPAELHPRALQSSVGADGAVSLDTFSPALLTGTVAAGIEQGRSADDLTALAMAAGSSSLEKHADGSAIDAGGLVPDVAHVNSWVQHVQEVDPIEMLEVQLCNSTAPFILISRLRASMAASPARRTYVVNVSAMEGQFSRKYKGPGHPHTNMAKAALNMLTRTSAEEMFETDGILMTAVDTGWITDERPHYTKVRLAEEGFHAPLDLVDGAARVYDPIVRGEAGEDLYGCFVKDYEPSAW
ncbi:short subunit dehydrogenase [Leucobacter komagatae]|uniref:Short subunit dehydrogenase n=1 Tax=Leucobacter komagatae TaxID=55969 RepID=A0A542Y9U7_9MICO|nr:SDR family NAD(P)-dependent oxidoreductase [Leucobacter komagatae]TQL44868.1 short subunit dehydrogenase [Leucobacter komagatae]